MEGAGEFISKWPQAALSMCSIQGAVLIGPITLMLTYHLPPWLLRKAAILNALRAVA